MRPSCINKELLPPYLLVGVREESYCAIAVTFFHWNKSKTLEVNLVWILCVDVHCHVPIYEVKLF
jgi:hypothetical protein